MPPLQGSVSAPLVSNPPPTRARLDYLDGIRAVTALYVSLFHATLHAIWTHRPTAFAGLSAVQAWAIRVFLSGHFGVGVFIALSGYCLMIPVARHGGDRLPGGIAAFLWRRARRILHPIMRPSSCLYW